MLIERHLTGPNNSNHSSESSLFSKTTIQIYTLTSALYRYRHLDHPHHQLSPQTIQLLNELSEQHNQPLYTKPTRQELWQHIEQALSTLIPALKSLPANDYSFLLRDYLTAAIHHPYPSKPLIGLTYPKPYNAIVRPLVVFLNNADRKHHPQQPQFPY